MTFTDPSEIEVNLRSSTSPTWLSIAPVNRIAHNAPTFPSLFPSFFSLVFFFFFFFLCRYHIVELLLHEGFDEREDLVHEPDRVQHVNSLEPDRHAFLEILKVSPDAIYRQSHQVAETHALHVEEEHISRWAAVRVEARVDGHQQQLDAVVEHVVGRLGVQYPMKNYPMAVMIRLRKHRELPATKYTWCMNERKILYSDGERKRERESGRKINDWNIQERRMD